PFYTESDTEVIIALYDRFGIDFVSLLNGQFAIALYDIRLKKTFLIRDRVGIAPLFYHSSGDTVYFASEVKALLVTGKVPARLNTDAFFDFIHLWSVLAPDTLFTGIKQVSPGCYVEIDQTGISTKRYWDFDFQPSDEQSIDDAVEKLDQLLDDAVKIRLRSDVPVGAYLSGGLDSTIILSYLTRQGADLETFSLTFDDAQLNEESFQSEVIRYFSTRHHSYRADYQLIADNFIKTIWHTESPLFRTSPTPMMLLSSEVHANNFKVVLTGEGADEIFGGYDIFKEAKIRQFWSRNPESSWRPLLLKRLYPYLDFNKINSIAYLKNTFGHNLSHTNSLSYAFNTRANITSAVKNFMQPDIKHQMDLDLELRLQEHIPIAAGQFGVFNTAQYVESRTIMAGYILSSQGDRMLMANSVEGRYPFLDHRVIEFAGGLKNSFKMNGLNEKYILKQMVKERIPASVLKRPKQPYRAPDINALMQSKDNQLLDFLSEDQIRKNALFDPAKVTRLVNKAIKGRAQSVKDNMLFTNILSTQIWVEKFIQPY
ncbi:MAG: asparagine synthase (glutamine-hydrolyzing), partial [Gammaproteobacteria bacterium]|nr:asparagine synthase (glutamine-hydrolyzing) [Gammaproteobacteria bacterium]